MARRWLPLALGAVIGFGLAGPALAQVALPSIERDAVQWDADYRFAVHYQKGAAIDGGGSLEIMEYATSAWTEGPLTENIQFHLDAAYSFTAYDFGAASGCRNPMVSVCFSNNPWQDIHRVDVVPGASLALTPAIWLRLSFPVRWNAEGNADENAVTAGMLLQLQWRMSAGFYRGIRLRGAQ